MRLIDELNARLQTEDSYFRQHLIKEDLARLQNLVAIHQETPDEAPFLKAALMIGWTPDDLRTFELKPTLQPLLSAIHARLDAASAPAAKTPDGNTDTNADITAMDDRIAVLWDAFQIDRMERLVGCLARVPRPRD